MEPQNWILRVADGKSFEKSMERNIWAVNTKNNSCRNFIKNVKPNDILWFLTNYNSGKKIIAVAVFISSNKRELGPIFNLTPSNGELGWREDGEWDVEVHFNSLYLIDKLNIKPEMNHPSPVVNCSKVKCDTEIDWVNEWKCIQRYSQVVKLT